jgi:hypothetical protein
MTVCAASKLAFERLHQDVTAIYFVGTDIAGVTISCARRLSVLAQDGTEMFWCCRLCGEQAGKHQTQYEKE